MTTEADKEYRREALYTLGVAESIVQRLEAMRADAATVRNWGDVGDIKHVHGLLREIEDRLYGCGEYARENVATLPPLPLAVVTHMKKVSR